jgi:methanogenic corrinoid protein MtbC1
MKHTLSADPIYNIKSVAEQTGILPVTLRAWERRYNFPEPQRSGSGYRLYSEHDIAALNWLKAETEAGLAIGRAVNLLRKLIDDGNSPLVKGMVLRAYSDHGFTSTGQLQPALVGALTALDEDEAHKIIQIAFGMFRLEQVLLEVIQPTLVEVGEMWHRGEISVATEHFSSQLCRLYLINALHSTKRDARQGSLIAACAPGEWHELGLLTLTVMLRLRGWGVTYLGANLSLDRLHEMIALLKPQMLLFSATNPEAANNLAGLTAVLDQLPDPKPIIALGGQAFLKDPTLTNKLPGTFMGPNADDAVRQIETLLSQIGAN